MMRSNSPNNKPALSRKLMTPAIVGLATIGLSVGVFGTWGATAPISGAAVAQGTVGPENSRRVVQHLEGGVIHSIKVKDGETVARGQVLVVLDDTKARAQYESQEVVVHALMAKQQRLQAETKMYMNKTPLGELVFSDALLQDAKTNETVGNLLNAEQARYVSRRAALDSQIVILQQTIDGYGVEIAGLQKEIAAVEEQIKVLEQVNVLYADLQNKGLESQSKVLDSLQKISASKQSLAERHSRVDKLREAIKASKFQLEDLWTARIDEITSELSTVSEDVMSAVKTLTSYKNTLDRTVIVSPVNGTLISLAVNTEGAVVGAGQTVVEIVPADDALKLEVKVDPNDVDVIKPGQSALVTLLSYPQRNLPKLHAILDEVSADSLVDSTDGTTYYTAKLTIGDGELAKLGEGIRLLPGMPVQAMIQTSSRTFFDYLLSPLIDYADLAFRE